MAYTIAPVSGELATIPWLLTNEKSLLFFANRVSPFRSFVCAGGHINPAVTLALFIIGEIEAPAAAAYIVTQFVAAVLGAALVWGCMADQMLKEEQGGCK